MLTSSRNPRVAAARKLLTPRGRAAADAFLAEGPQAVREALAHTGALVSELFVTDAAAARHEDVMQAAVTGGVLVHAVDERLLAMVSDTVTPQGMVAVVRRLDVPLAVALGGSPRLVALLAEVRDPGNAGSVIRVADAAGADAVVLTAGSVDLGNPKVVRASAGSAFHLPLVGEVSAAEAVDSLHAAWLQVLAADGRADLDLDAAADSGLLTRPTAWLFGNEAWGLPQEVRALADRVVAVPIHGRAESLNLATAAAVCLYASARAQRSTPRQES